jgi:hypothetical protein
MSYGTDLIVEPPSQQFTAEGRRRPDSRIIFTGGTPGPRGATSSSSFRILGSVATVGALPGGAAEGDAYMVLADNHVYVWNSTAAAWQDIGALTIGVQSSDGSVGDIRAMTQAEYDAIPVKDPLAFYIIKLTP